MTLAHFRGAQHDTVATFHLEVEDEESLAPRRELSA